MQQINKKPYTDIERWKSIPIPELSHYSISNHGRVFNTLSSRYLKGWLNEEGYNRVGLSKLSGKRACHYVHRLVAMAFVSKRHGALDEVNHKDNDRTNNHWSNLEYLTHLENMRFIGSDWLAEYDYCPF